MAKNSIKLSQKHGVNPSLVVCPLCNKEYSIALLGKLKDDVKAPMTIYGPPCDNCMTDIVENDRVFVAGINEETQPIGFAVVDRKAFGEDFPKDTHNVVMREKDFKDYFKEMLNPNKEENNDTNI